MNKEEWIAQARAYIEKYLTITDDGYEEIYQKYGAHMTPEEAIRADFAEHD